jgi:hypothetical protein
VHTSLAGRADTATLRKVSEEPLGMSRVAVGRLNDALNSMSRGAK